MTLSYLHTDTQGRHWLLGDTTDHTTEVAARLVLPDGRRHLAGTARDCYLLTDADRAAALALLRDQAVELDAGEVARLIAGKAEDAIRSGPWNVDEPVLRTKPSRAWKQELSQHWWWKRHTCGWCGLEFYSVRPDVGCGPVGTWPKAWRFPNGEVGQSRDYPKCPGPSG